MSFLRVPLLTLIFYYLFLDLEFCKVYQNCLVTLIKITTVYAYWLLFMSPIMNFNSHESETSETSAFETSKQSVCTLCGFMRALAVLRDPYLELASGIENSNF